jgi:DNA gyrase subunit A
VTRFGFSELQAQAILEMRLQRLTGMERDKLEGEYAEVLADRRATSDPRLGRRPDGRGGAELQAVRDRFADPRRTRIVEARSELSMHDLVAEEDQVVTLSHLGYIKRCRPDEWRTQKRGGVGKKGMARARPTSSPRSSSPTPTRC